MIYVVKCFYCEHEFKVKRGETGADMMCPKCGKANSIRDVIKRIEDKKTVDPDLQAIKDFDISKHPVINDETYRRHDEFGLFDLITWLENASAGQTAFFLIIVILLILLAICTPIFLP